MKQYADIARLFGAFVRKICLLKRIQFRLLLATRDVFIVLALQILVERIEALVSRVVCRGADHLRHHRRDRSCECRILQTIGNNVRTVTAAISVRSIVARSRAKILQNGDGVTEVSRAAG